MYKLKEENKIASTFSIDSVRDYYIALNQKITISIVHIRKIKILWNF